MLRNVMAIDNGKIIGIPSAASGVSYDNTNSGLTSTNVQDAIDEVSGELSDKVDKVAGKGLSTNDYTNADKGIVDGVTSALAGKVSTTSVGSANGVAELDANGRVPSSQLPSYVDDVLEYSDLAHFPATGETGKIYIAEDTNKTYRWSGSDYAEISESLALGETSSTAYAGNKGKANADAIAAIKDGTNIDSFGDVETALAGKADSSDLTRMISKLLFGGYSNYYRTTQTSIDGIVDNVVIAPQTDDTGYFSADNKATIVGFGNRQFVFGYVNTSKKYAWIIVCSFSGISVGTRENASVFTFKSLTS